MPPFCVAAQPVAATQEPQWGQEDLGQESGMENLPALIFLPVPVLGSGAEIAAVRKPCILSPLLRRRAREFTRDDWD
jgi:hypothetical protein